MTATHAPTVKRLALKLAEIMAEVETLPKNGYNEHFKYHFVKEEDVAAVIRAGLAKRQVALLPSVTDVCDETLVVKTRDGEKTKTITTIRMLFSFIDGETGEQIDRQWAGRGEDASDKGLYKAITGGNKYFLLKAFQIPTGDDPEHDRHDRGARQGRRTRDITTRDGARVDGATGEVKGAAPKPNGSTGSYIDSKQQRALIEASKQAGWSDAERVAWLRNAGYGEWSKIPGSDYSSVLAVMQGGSDAGGAQ